MNRLLLSAIDHYDSAVFGGNINLSGCQKDIDRVEPHLPSGLTRYLVNEAATKAALIATLKTFAEECQPGDTFIWYHSGHGTMQDTGKGRMTMRVVHDGYLTDAEVAAILATFLKEVTVISFSDTCYAHSNSRNVSADLRPRSMLYRGPVITPTVLKVKYAATIYNVSACDINQVAWENAEGGIFTTKLITVLQKTGTQSINAIVKLVHKTIVGQTPTLETTNASKMRVPRI